MNPAKDRPQSELSLAAEISDPDSRQNTQPGSDVLIEAAPVLDLLKLRIAAVLDELDEDLRRGIDVSTVLGLTRALGWSIFHVVNAPDGLSAVGYIPSPATLRNFLRAAGERGVSAQTIGRVYEAFAAFEVLVARHANNHSSFTTLIRDQQGKDCGTNHLKLRRTAYRVHQELLGVHADMFFQMSMFSPQPGTDMLENVSIKGWVGIQRSRSATQMLSENALTLVAHDNQPLPMPRPIEPEDGQEFGVSPLKRFCSKPLPIFKSFIQQDTLITQTFSNEVGKKSACTYFFGGITREPQRSKTHPTFRAIRSYITVPTKVFIRDVWIHSSLCGTKPPYAEFYYQRRTFMMDRGVQVEDALPQQAGVELLGAGVDAALGREISRYPEMVCSVAQKIGCDLEEFRLYRCRVEYPMLNSAVRLVLPLAP